MKSNEARGVANLIKSAGYWLEASVVELISYHLTNLPKRILLLKEVKKRCELCNKSIDGEYEVHHKDGCGLNWQRNNLMVLCIPCHRILTGQINRNRELPLNWVKHPAFSLDEIKEQYIRSHPRA